MELISDGLLLAAALAATFYCWAISARLGTLKRQSRELATRLDEFNASIGSASTMISATREAAEAESAHLASLVNESRALQERLEEAAALLHRASKSVKPVKPRLRSEDEGDEDLLAGMRRLASRHRVRDAS